MNKSSIKKRMTVVLLIAAILLCLPSCTTSKYETASKLLVEDRYTEAALIFDELGNYEDSEKLTQYANAVAAGEQGDFVTCFNEFADLDDFNDSQLRLQYYTARQYESQAIVATTLGEGSEASQLYVEALKNYHALSLYLDADMRKAVCVQAMYDLPATLASNGDYAGAASAMTCFVNYMKQERDGVGIYEDAPLWIDYYTACHYETTGEYKLAADFFACLGNFNDAVQRCEKMYFNIHEAAEIALVSGEYDKAWNLFVSIPEYKNSLSRAKEIHYRYGIVLMDGDDYTGARIAFTSSDDYGDANARIQECIETEIELMQRRKEYEKAILQNIQYVDFPSEDFIVFITNEGKYGFVNTKTGEIIEPKWDWADSFSDGMAPVKLNNKVGYINTMGKIVIEPVWEAADQFSEGMAGVQKDCIWGYIDRDGNVIIKPQWSIAGDFSNGMAMVGLVTDSNGVLLTGDDVWKYGLEKKFNNGFIDKMGSIVIDPKWEIVKPFHEEVAAVCVDGKWGYIDKNDNIISEFNDGMAKIEINGKWGYIDKNGAVIIEPQWDDIGDFYDGVAKIKLDRKWGYIDKAGVVIIEPQLDYAKNFSEGVAVAQRDFKYGYIDKTGTFVIEPQWQDANDFCDGVAAVRLEDKWGYIDHNGTMVIPAQWQNEFGFTDGRAVVVHDDKQGLIDQNGNLLTGKTFDNVTDFIDGLSRAEQEGKSGLINGSGEIIIGFGVIPTFPLEYEETSLEYWHAIGEKMLNAQNPDYAGAKAAFAKAGYYNDAPFAAIYADARLLMVEGDYNAAYTKLVAIKGYKDVDVLLTTDTNFSELNAHEIRISPFKNVGHYVSYGAYEQDNDTQNGKEAIEWLVLDYNQEEQRVLLISRYGLDARSFHSIKHYPPWENSDMRIWLNNEFVNTAFTTEEQIAIAETKVITPDYYGNDGGADTMDRIFLLSREEVEQYLSAEALRMVVPTEYALTQGAFASTLYMVNGFDCCGWWLRSSGSSNRGFFASVVEDSGTLSESSVSYDGNAVRPALILDLDAI